MTKMKNFNLGASLEVIVTMVLAFGALALLVLCAGCSTYSTQQKDISYDPKTGQNREITTTVKAGTFIASKSALTNSKASQTDKTQSAVLGSLNQESDATATLKAITELIQATKPVPK